MKEIVEKILNKLRDLYPHMEINITKPSNVRHIVHCNNKTITEFNPTLLQAELSYFEDRPDYLDLFIDAIREPIDKYNKTLSATVLKGRGSKGLSVQQINDAISKTKSCLAASRYLKVAYQTFVKYAKMYKDENGVSLFEKHKNPKGIGVSRNYYSGNMGKYSLQDIIDGKGSPNYPIWKFKRRLIKFGFVEEKCAICGYSERRITDLRVPIEIDFIDGNKLNKSLDNVRMLCFNCYFLNVKNLDWRKRK